MEIIHSLTVTSCKKNLFNQKPFKESFLPRGVKDNAEAEVERYNQNFWLTILLTSKSWESVAMDISDLMSLVLHLTVKRI